MCLMQVINSYRQNNINNLFQMTPSAFIYKSNTTLQHLFENMIKGKEAELSMVRKCPLA